MAYTGGRIHPRGVPFQALVGEYMKGQGFYQFKYMKKTMEVCLFGLQQNQKKDKQIYFVDVKDTRKLSSSVIDLYSKEGANTAIKRLNQVYERSAICQ